MVRGSGNERRSRRSCGNRARNHDGGWTTLVLISLAGQPRGEGDRTFFLAPTAGAIGLQLFHRAIGLVAQALVRRRQYTFLILVNAGDTKRIEGRTSRIADRLALGDMNPGM